MRKGKKFRAGSLRALPAVCLCLALLGGCGGDTAGSSALPENPSSDAGTSGPLSSSGSEAANTKLLTGTVYDAAMQTIVIEDGEGNRYAFLRDPALLDAPDGILLGAAVTVAYKGVLGRDGDTSGAEVVKITVSPLSGIFDDYLPRAKELTAALTPEQKIAQMLLSATFEDGGDPVAQTKKDQPGGYVLFKRDFEGLSADEVRQKLADMQAASEIPMLMAVDEEGGNIVRISSNPQLRPERFPSPAELYQQGLEAVQTDASEKADLLLDLGCNVLLAPVADVSEHEGDYIHDRTVGLPAADTASFVRTVVETVQQKGCGAVTKHFPGYGNNLNTHYNVSMDERPYETFVNSDFLPFQAGIDAGGDGVLVSHNIVISMDADLPASLSPKVHEILRDELRFTGIIMTDDLGMDAIGLYTGDEDPAVLAVLAGNDLLLTQDFPDTYGAVLKAFQAGRIEEDTLTEAVERVFSWKLKLGLME